MWSLAAQTRFLRSKDPGEGVAAALSTSLTLCRVLMSGKLTFLLSRSEVVEVEDERDGCDVVCEAEALASLRPFSTEDDRRR